MIFAGRKSRFLLVRRFARKRIAMATVAATRLSSKGQVVIPEEVRRRLNLKAGDRFLVTGEDDVVILKTLSPPRLQDFDRIVGEARRQARAAGLSQADIAAAVARARLRS